jgi:hypothetical protein
MSPRSSTRMAYANQTSMANLNASLSRILAEPTPHDLWEIQKHLLALGGEPAERARDVARAFHSCLRNLDSKTASRSASRWGAALGTAAVSSVGLQEVLAKQGDSLRHLMASGVAALLETGSAVKTAQAWEVEAGLMYDDMAWYLYGQLWDISRAARPQMSAAERLTQIDLLLDPVLDREVSDKDRAALVVRLFQAILAARMWPIVGGGLRSDPHRHPDSGSAVR